jgi:hypothetical protein
MTASPARYSFAEAHDYDLYVAEEVVGRLRWRARSPRLTGWYLTAGAAPERRLAVDPALDRLTETPAARSELAARADIAVLLTTALALDEAGRVLRGPLPPTPQPAPTGLYELHVADFDWLDLGIVFPEAASFRAGDATILTGQFDDAGLALVARRTLLVGGRVVGVFGPLAPPLTG